MAECAGGTSVDGTWRHPSRFSAIFFGSRPRYLVPGAPSLNLYIGREPAQFFLPEVARLGFYHELLTGDGLFDGETHAYVDDREWVELLKASPAVRHCVMQVLAFRGVRAVGCEPRGAVFAEWGRFDAEQDAENLPRVAAALKALGDELRAASIGRAQRALARLVWRRYLMLLPLVIATVGSAALLALPSRPIPDSLAFLFTSTTVAASIGLAVLTLVALRPLVHGSTYAHRIFFTNVVFLVPAYMAGACAVLTYADYRAASASAPEKVSALVEFSEGGSGWSRRGSGPRYFMQIEARFPESVVRSEWVTSGRPKRLRLSREQYERVQWSPAVTIEYWRSNSGTTYIAQLRAPLAHEFTVPSPAEVEAAKRRVMDPIFRDRLDPNAR